MALAAFAFPGNASEKPTNVVLFLVDDAGWMDTSDPMLAEEEGQAQRHPLNDWYRTPKMKRLAAKGGGVK